MKPGCPTYPCPGDSVGVTGSQESAWALKSSGCSELTITSDDFMSRGGPDPLKRELTSGGSSECPSLPCNPTDTSTRHLLTIHLSPSDRPFHLHREQNPAPAPAQTLLPPTSPKAQWDLVSADVWSALIFLISSPLATVTVPCMKDDSPHNSDSHLRNTDVLHVRLK